MWTFLSATGTTPREVALAQIIKNYEAKSPGTKIVVETQVWDQMTPKFIAAHSAGNAPDIVWAITDFLGDAINSGSLADLNALFIKNWPAAQVADHKSAYWDLTRRGDKQYAMFVSPNYISILYRADLFKAAGIEPAQIKTWDDLRQAAEKLTVRDAAGQVTRYGYAQAYSEQQTDPHMMIPYVLGNGESIFKPDGKANFATPLGIEAMTYATDLVTKYKVAPVQSATWTVDDMFEQFASDRVAMIQGPSVRVSTLQAKLGKDKIGMMLWPGSKTMAHSPAVMAGWAVGVWSKSQNAEEAGKFVDFMLGGESELIWVTVGGQSPLMASTAEAVKVLRRPARQRLHSRRRRRLVEIRLAYADRLQRGRLPSGARQGYATHPDRGRGRENSTRGSRAAVQSPEQPISDQAAPSSPAPHISDQSAGRESAHAIPLRWCGLCAAGLRTAVARALLARRLRPLVQPLPNPVRRADGFRRPRKLSPATRRSGARRHAQAQHRVYGSGGGDSRSPFPSRLPSGSTGCRAASDLSCR